MVEKSKIIQNNKAFTLIELLIVIAIIAILGSATVLVLNPVELMKQGRDGTRVQDVENIQKSVQMSLFNNPALFGSLASTKIYLSLPSGSCPSNPPAGYTYECFSSTANINKVNGSGWLPVSLTNIAALPTDPNPGDQNYYYAFVADPTNKTFVVTSLLESEKQLKTAAAKDGGVSMSRFEKGTVSLWAKGAGLVGFWPMDEGSGTTIRDLSGNGTTLNGTAIGSPTWTTGANCKVGTCLTFNSASSQKVNISNNSKLNLNGASGMSMSAWVKTASVSTGSIINKSEGTTLTAYALSVSPANVSLLNGKSAKNGNKTVNDGVWRHIVTTISGTSPYTYNIYVDGVLDSTGTSTEAISTNTNTLALAGQNDSGYGSYFTGTIDQVRLYNRTLTDDEIKSMYIATR